jgi:hypothetical protein
MSGSLLFYSNHFDRLASISVITTLIPYIFFCVAAWLLDPSLKHRIISGTGMLSTAAILIIYFIV